MTETTDAIDQTVQEPQVRDGQEERGGRRVSKEQRRVVDAFLDQPITVVGAGAGSGKTYTMVAAIIEHLQQGWEGHLKRTDINEFVVITFTNKAADDVRSKIRQGLHQQYDRAKEDDNLEEARFWRTQTERLSAAYVGTIHSFCRWILRTYGYEQQIPRTSDVSFSNYVRKQSIKTVLNDELEDDQIRRLYSTSGPLQDYELIKLVESVLSEIYNRGLDVHEVVEWTQNQPDDEGKPYREAFAQLVEQGHERYKQEKNDQNALDSYQLLRETLRLLNGDHGDSVVGRITNRYRFLLIDEFQDTDETQLDIIDRLYTNGDQGLQKVLAVGDQKQSIYGWRGSPEALLQNFADTHEVDIREINVSRRPTQSYLDAQNALIRSMGMDILDPFDGTWDPEVDLRSPFTYVNAGEDPSANAQDQRIEATATVLQGLLDRQIHIQDQDPGDIQPGHIVILARRNQTLETYAEGLREHFSQNGFPNVNFEVDRGEAFYQRPEVTATCFLLRVLERGAKDAVLSAALDTPFLADADATNKELELVQFGTRREGSLLLWLQRNHQKYAQAFDDLEDHIQQDTVPQLLERMYRAFGVRNFYRQRGRPDCIEGLDRLQEIARQLYDDDEALTLRAFTNHLETSILTEQDSPQPPAVEEEGYPSHVRLMTVHRAKGLEFPIVVLPEVQYPMSREDEPPFLVLEPRDDSHEEGARPGGIEIQLSGPDTTSNQYDNALVEHRMETEGEERRILYVAVTRAEHGAILIGSGPMHDDPPRRRDSWRDEVFHARQQLQEAGGAFFEL